ncbi:uncharacterized protein LOC126213286 [Schistocerca nitens]|uniref:uncharacterized protein LOC126213286 n=1 Tax=Schistocerca nitens TaxID=7011 RepID=UPI002117BDB0|nr:uncharacterized protein LOC126213286 [Schistocerca nitens]
MNNPEAVPPKSIRNAVNSKQKKELADRNGKKNSERRVLKSRNKHINEQKEHCNAIIYENKNDGVGKNEVSCSIQSSNNINYGKLKPNTTVSVLGKDSKESTNDENSKCTTKKTENMKTSDMSNDFTKKKFCNMFN